MRDTTKLLYSCYFALFKLSLCLGWSGYNMLKKYLLPGDGETLSVQPIAQDYAILPERQEAAEQF